MPKSTNGKRITIDKLARIINREFQRTNKYIKFIDIRLGGEIKGVRGEIKNTEQRLRREMRTGFRRVDKRFEGLEKRMDSLAEDFGDIRKQQSRFVTLNQHGLLKKRVLVLEKAHHQE